MQDIFDRCRGIPASAAARREGITLQKRGSREWACCPFHGEKTASMMFDENGKWHCFGCNIGGDAVAFLAKLYNLKPYEAAQRLLGEYGSAIPTLPPRPTPRPGHGLKEALEQWHRKECVTAKKILDREADAMAAAEKAVLEKGLALDDVWEDPAFCAAILLHSAAQDRLNQLDIRDEDALADLYLTETKTGEKEEAPIIRSLKKRKREEDVRIS